MKIKFSEIKNLNKDKVNITNKNPAIDFKLNN